MVEHILKKKNSKYKKIENVIKKCPYCGKQLSSKTRENPNEHVLKIRFLIYQINGGPVSVKCRHCGHLVEIPYLNSIS